MLLETVEVVEKMVLLHLKVHPEELQAHPVQQMVYLTMQVEINQLAVVVVEVLLVVVLVVIQVETTEVVEVPVVVLLQEQLSQTEVGELQATTQATTIKTMVKVEVEAIHQHNQMVIADL
jgi:hypothetical protein